MLSTLRSYFTQNYTWQHFTVLYITAFLLRAATFGLYVQYEERYKQADSFDYHFCAACLKTDNGMSRFDNKEPIFWRTPGYPLYLNFFYTLWDIKTADFTQNSTPQKASIWLQIILCSFIPLLIFFLVHSLTYSLPIAWMSAWISAFHLGFILASCYILSDALAQIFFISFLYFFYKSFTVWFESSTNNRSTKAMLYNTALAALMLGLYTWIRPNGQFVVAIGAVLLLLGHCTWRIKLSKIVIFIALFFAIISGWYMRNYNLTGHWFFCPMSGPYLQSFCAPKIIRRVSNQSLEKCLNYILSQVVVKTKQEMDRLAHEAPHLYLSRELICKQLATQWILNYPWYFLCDWTKEVVKTTFDLYASQLVAMVNKTHMYDPLEEFLGEKIALCLYKQPMPLLMRLIIWMEFIFWILLWIGLCIGSWIFILQPLWLRTSNTTIRTHQALWLKTTLLIGGMLVMTGGFGYARLRMPVDPLLIMLSVVSWYYYFVKNSYNIKRNDEKIVCAMA